MRKLKLTKKNELFSGSSSRRVGRFLPITCTSLFIVACLSFYYHAMQKKSELHGELIKKQQELKALKALSLEEREDLVLQIGSQNEVEWIEMVLKKRLGVVPEGQTKVFFKNK
jgi:hypothetical protein